MIEEQMKDEAEADEGWQDHSRCCWNNSFTEKWRYEIQHVEQLFLNFTLL